MHVIKTVVIASVPAFLSVDIFTNSCTGRGLCVGWCSKNKCYLINLLNKTSILGDFSRQNFGINWGDRRLQVDKAGSKIVTWHVIT